MLRKTPCTGIRTRSSGTRKGMVSSQARLRSQVRQQPVKLVALQHFTQQDSHPRRGTTTKDRFTSLR